MSKKGAPSIQPLWSNFNFLALVGTEKPNPSKLMYGVQDPAYIGDLAYGDAPIPALEAQKEAQEEKLAKTDFDRTVKEYEKSKYSEAIEAILIGKLTKAGVSDEEINKVYSLTPEQKDRELDSLNNKGKGLSLNI